ncbi:MAG: OB-fold protein [Ginsengibacter sp.]
MERKTKRNIFSIFIAMIVIAAVIGFMMWNEPHRDIKDSTALKTTAVVLYSNLTKDSARMKSKLVNQIVEVSGEVKNVLKNQKGAQIILLKTNTSGGSINCTMEEKISNVKPGETISIKGLCSGYIGGDPDIDLPGDVFLVRCYPST